MKIVVFINAFQLVSGGDVIAVEIAKRWIKKGHKVCFITNEKGLAFCLTRNVPRNLISVWKDSWIDFSGPYLSGLYKTIWSVIGAFISRNKYDVIFSSSFFLPDILAGVITKLRSPESKLLVGAYLIFPNPFIGEKYSGGIVKSIVLYLSQILSLWLIDHYADLVLTASDKDRHVFINDRQLDEIRVIAIRGGVDTNTIKTVPPQKKKIADAVYLGRFHHQKNLHDLLSVWKKVHKKRPKSKLLLVGDGPLLEELKRRIEKMGLTSVVSFRGITEGKDKYKIYKSTKVFISTSQFDSGNISLDEALACGLPGIVYDSPRLNYPTGVIKIPSGDQNLMAEGVINLLNDKKRRDKLGKEGKRFVSQFDWEKGSKRILPSIFKAGK